MPEIDMYLNESPDPNCPECAKGYCGTHSYTNTDEFNNDSTVSVAEETELEKEMALCSQCQNGSCGWHGTNY